MAALSERGGGDADPERGWRDQRNDNELPSAGRRSGEPNPFAELVKAAAKDGKRRDLPGRFSLAPYDGKKSACEAFTVISKLHSAEREAGVKLAVRRFEADATSCRVTLKVQT